MPAPNNNTQLITVVTAQPTTLLAELAIAYCTRSSRVGDRPSAGFGTVYALASGRKCVKDLPEKTTSVMISTDVSSNPITQASRKTCHTSKHATVSMTMTVMAIDFVLSSTPRHPMPNAANIAPAVIRLMASAVVTRTQSSLVWKARLAFMEAASFFPFTYASQRSFNSNAWLTSAPLSSESRNDTLVARTAPSGPHQNSFAYCEPSSVITNCRMNVSN
mmetsp:Transcript_11347/g.25210  ORF Transcript_11347/g.25210 Transcript_11347/m.25210 type:complete len:219 (+) Transcript_11347:254-910(+)